MGLRLGLGSSAVVVALIAVRSAQNVRGIRIFGRCVDFSTTSVRLLLPLKSAVLSTKSFTVVVPVIMKRLSTYQAIALLLAEAH